MSYVAPSSPSSIGGVLDSWLRLFRESFSRCWALAALAAASVGALVFLSTPTLPPDTLALWQQRLQMWSLLNGPQGALASVLMIVVALIATGALLAAQVAVMRGQPPTFAQALGTGLRRFPRMLGGFILLMLIMIGVGMAVAVPLVIVAVVGGVAAALAHHPAGGITGDLWALGLLLILVILAAVLVSYVTVRLQLWQAAIFTDDDDAMASLRRSWRLVGGNWWRTTSILFVGGIVIAVLGYVVPWVVGLMFGVFAQNATSLEHALRTVRLIQLFAQATRVITLPLTTALSLAIYHDLKLRREGADLAARTEALSGA